MQRRTRDAHSTTATPATGRRQASAPALLKPRSPPPLLRRAHSLGSWPVRDVAGSLVVGAARTLQRAVSGYFGLSPPVATTLCQICFENVPTTDTIELTTCHHRFCRHCIKQYLELKIKDGNVFPICFHPVEPQPTSNSSETASTLNTTTCATRIADAQLEAIVDREVWAKCTLFRFNKANATARECPFCAHPQQCAGPKQPACSCEQCGREFCFFHGNAHVDSTCADYELKHAKSETQSRATIARVAKPCPGCKSNVEKSGGCNHMTCVVCQTEFCWLCNNKLERGNVSEHFSSTNFSSCGGRQFDNVDAEGRESLWSRFSRLHGALHLQFSWRLYQVTYFLAYPPAIVLSLVLWLLLKGVTRVRPIASISSTPFSSLVKISRVGVGGVTAFAAFVYTFKLLPESVNMVYWYVHQIKVYGDLAVVMWPRLVSRSRLVWAWVWVRANHLRGQLRSRRLSDPLPEDHEREALYA